MTDVPRDDRRLQLTAGGLLLLGLLLLATAFVWPRVWPARRVWSDEQAESYAEAAGRYHELTFRNSGSRDREEAAALEQARRDYDERRSRLDTALAVRRWGSVLLRVLGVVSALAGALLLAIVQSRRDRR